MNVYSIRRACVPLLLITVAAADPCAAAGQDDAVAEKTQSAAEKPAGSGANRTRRTNVQKLQNANADRVAEVLQQIFSDRLSVAAESTTNSLILSSTEDVMEEAEALTQRLDSPELHRKPESRSNDQTLQVFRLKYAEGVAAAEVVSGMFPVSVAWDRRTNSLILRGSEENIQRITGLLEVLDSAEDREPEQADQTSAREQRRLLFYWLASGRDLRTDQPMPPQVQPVVKELDRLGIKNLQLVSRSVAALDGTEVSFSNLARAGDASYELSVEGRLSSGGAGSEVPRLHLTVRAIRWGTEDESHLQTTVSTPFGHFVVLGVTGMGDLESAFVIQIQNGESAKEGEDAKPSQSKK